MKHPWMVTSPEEAAGRDVRYVREEMISSVQSATEESAFANLLHRKVS